MPAQQPLLRVALYLACAASLPAQSVRIYSEFQRIGTDGAVIAADRQERSREILSPAVARNAHFSCHVVVSAPAGSPFTLHFAQNPENAFRATFYREIHDPAGVPDRLEKIQLPLESKIDDAGHPLVLWMDLWVDAAAPVRRVRVEPQLWIGGGWVIYPLEVRVFPNIVPDIDKDSSGLPPASAPADAFAMGPLRALLCGRGEPAGSVGQTVRRMIQRNARQDAALAGVYAKVLERETVVKRLMEEAGFPDRQAWCADSKAARPPGAAGPEWYLKIRDRLVRGW